ncbi:MAG: MerR family transcriptional regulator [Bacillota bacterium]|nr:MerR family transcriptional regulator [Bacillota bacterium]
MSIANCPNCGALFVPGPKGVCPRCAQLEEEQFELVKAFLLANPDAVLAGVSEATGVEQQAVLRFIRSSRLVVGRPQSFGLTCDRCGDPVSTGHLCPSCAKELAHQIKGLDARGRNRMHSIEIKRMH